MAHGRRSAGHRRALGAWLTVARRSGYSSRGRTRATTPETGGVFLPRGWGGYESGWRLPHRVASHYESVSWRRLLSFSMENVCAANMAAGFCLLQATSLLPNNRHLPRYIRPLRTPLLVVLWSMRAYTCKKVFAPLVPVKLTVDH